jgi:lipopolysaccharide assembly protein A
LKLVHWLVTVPVALLLIIFAVSNREVVAVTFWPLPVQLGAPLWLVVLLACLLGFLFGELVAWIGGRRWRRDARQKTRRIESLERELAATQAQLPADAAARLPGARLPVVGSPRAGASPD